MGSNIVLINSAGEIARALVRVIMIVFPTQPIAFTAVPITNKSFQGRSWGEW